MNDQNQALVAILPDIERAARQTELEWPTVIAADEITQEVSLQLLSDGYATTVRAMDDTPRRQFLYRVGNRIAAGERISYEYFTGNFRYSTDEVRGRLDRGALVRVGEDPVDEETFTYSIEDIDIRRAFEELSDSQKRVLLSRFACNTYTGHTQYVTLAVDALTRELNWQHKRDHEGHDGPGSRKAVSNATAAYLTGNQERR